MILGAMQAAKWRVEVGWVCPRGGRSANTIFVLLPFSLNGALLVRYWRKTSVLPLTCRFAEGERVNYEFSAQEGRPGVRWEQGERPTHSSSLSPLHLSPVFLLAIDFGCWCWRNSTCCLSVLQPTCARLFLRLD